MTSECERGLSSKPKIIISKWCSIFQNPQEKAQAAKSKGNKYFKGGKYEQAIQCYTEAIGLCPPEHKSDISTFYQNRAAAHEQLVRYNIVTFLEHTYISFILYHPQGSRIRYEHRELGSMLICLNY